MQKECKINYSALPIRIGTQGATADVLTASEDTYRGAYVVPTHAVQWLQWRKLAKQWAVTLLACCAGSNVEASVCTQ